MKIATALALMLARLSGLVQVILGALFWTGHALTFIPVHMVVGLVLVLCLWTLAVLAARAGVQPGFVALAIAWGAVVPILGLNQAQLLPGPMHWVIQVLHLLLGLGAIAQAEGLAARLRVRLRPDRAATRAALRA